MNENTHDGSHDFDFLHGRWRIDNERLLERLTGCTDWERFAATGTARPILGGLGNIDDFVPDGWRPGFLGGTVRLFNLVTGRWSLYWMSNATGTLEPPVIGRFENGIGVFEGDDTLEGRPVRVRFTWSDITATSALWEQECSGDGGRTWEKNWTMRFARIGD